MKDHSSHFAFHGYCSLRADFATFLPSQGITHTGVHVWGKRVVEYGEAFISEDTPAHSTCLKVPISIPLIRLGVIVKVAPVNFGGIDCPACL